MTFSRFMRTTLGNILFLLLLILTLFQSYWFQNWAIQKLTTYLSTELNTKVQIEHIGIDFFNNLTLDGFYIEDLDGDTLIYAADLRLDYGVTWKTFYGKGLNINGLMLENAKINLKRSRQQQHNNAQFIIDYFVGNKPKDPNKKKGEPFDLKLEYLSFKQIDFRQKDEVAGQELYAYLDQGVIKIEEMDLLSSCVQINNIELIQPSIWLKQTTKHPFEAKAYSEDEARQPQPKPTNQVQSAPLHFTIRRFRMNGGRMVYDNFRASPERKKPYNLMDFNHLDFTNLNFDLDYLSMLGDEVTAIFTGLSLHESSGFILDKLAAQQFRFTPKSIELNSFVLKTPYTELRDTFQIKFRNFDEFKDFNNKVRFIVKLKNSHLALKDLMPFDRKIANNRFFIENQTERFDISGRITGKINNFSADSLQVKTKGLLLQGNVAINDVTDPDNIFINLKINKLASDIATIKLFSGRDSLPSGVEKFGRFNFKGEVLGFPYDFYAKGDLNTALGNAHADFIYKPDPKRGGISVYNGGISLIDFDLGEFTNSKDFGKVTLVANINNGTGVNVKTAEADLAAKVKSFTFKNYTYENLTYNGQLDSRLINGDFAIHDKNIDFTFKGIIDFRDSVPHFDFNAKVKHLKLQELNLSKQNLAFSGELDINLDGKKIEDIEGATRLKNISVLYNNENITLDSLALTSEILSDKSRRIDLSSNLINGFLEGTFDFKRLPKNIENYIVYHHPAIANRLKLNVNPLVIGLNDKITFKLDIGDLKPFKKIIHSKLDTLNGIHLEGYFDSAENILQLSSIIENFHFQQLKLTDFGYNINLERGKGDVDIQLYHTNINEKYHINLVTILGKLSNDSLLFDLNGNRVLGDLDSLSLNGSFTVKPNYFQVGFLASKFTLFDERWEVDADNYLRFDKSFIQTHNFDIRSGNRRITLESISDRGIGLKIKGFDFKLIDKVLKDNRFTFGGAFEVEARIQDIFTLSGIQAVVNADTLFWNKRDWGRFRLDAELANPKSPVKMALNITREDEQISGEGFYVLPGQSFVSRGKRYESNYLKTSLNTNNISLVWISYLIGSGVSNMKGRVDASLALEGPIKKLELDGKARVRDASFKIDYLNTTYHIKDESCKITTTLVDATGAKIYDEYQQNFAIIEGGLTHVLFDKMRLSCTIDSKEKDVLVMNTTREQNNLYYGKGIGRIKVRFSGSFSRTFINVERAITGKGTQLNIPVSNSQEAKEVTFVKFIDKKVNTTTPEKQKVKTSGLGFNMTLTMTEDADCKIIFNEQTGDVIQGTGRGVLQLDVPIEGDFAMKGDYTFNQGKYLFTIRQQFFSVDKPFTLRPGGTLRWDGDPFGAKMDIWADYSALNIAPYELIAPLLTTDEERQSAKQPTQVSLAMNLQGKLLKPDITFEILLPQLFGQLKSFADTRMNQIKLDASELNRQVFAIIVLGTFLPSSQQAIGSVEVNQAFNNTVSGIISNQLANYVNAWLNDVLKNNGIISGVDLNINTQAGIDIVTGTASFNSLQFRPRINLFDNRLAIDAGFVTSEFNNQTIVNSDIAIEWYITRDRLLRFRVYNRGVQDVQGQRNRTGAGLSWRKEFESWKDLFKKKKS
jgi:hypothetical protein